MKKSQTITKEYKPPKVSRMLNALEHLDEQINTEIKGQFGQNVIITSGDVTIKNSELDCEFTVDFDDDTEADEAEIIIFNLTDQTINAIKNEVTITAGYGNDTGIIFSGSVTGKKTYRDGNDKITEIRAVDSLRRQNTEIESISYAAGTKASYILKDLCGRVGLPIAAFSIARDYDYTDETTVDGSLSDNIQQYAEVCGVSAYVCKGKLYVRSLKDGDNTRFRLSSDTGLLSVSEFEKKTKTKEYGEETVKGCQVKCLLQHRMQTASIIELDSRNFKGRFRVKSGSHEYNGTDFITTAKIIQA